MIKNDVQLLKKEIQNSDIYKEYTSLKMQIGKSNDIKNLKKELNLLKQELTKNVSNKEIHSSLKEEYIKKQKQYDNHPLIQNFNYIKEELYEELNLIKEQINPWFLQL